MAGCLANHCARLESLGERRAFARQVATIELMQQGDAIQQFRAEVERLYKQRKSAA